MKSTSAAASKYYWMRYVVERATNIKTPSGTVSIRTKDLFGVREIRNSEFDEIMLTDGTVFKLSIAKSDLLMKRGKEYRGNVPVIAAPAKKAAVKAPAVVAPEKTPQSRLFVSKLKSVGLTLLSIGALKDTEFKKILASLPDDAQRIAFKDFVLSHLPRTSAKYQKIASYSPAIAKKPVSTVVPRTRKPIVAELKQSSTGTKLRVKLSEVEMPEMDDFTDYDVPSEFKHYARVQSSGNYMYCVASDSQVMAMSIASGDEFNSIVSKYLAPAVVSAKKVIEASVKQCASKIRAWAMTHLRQAQQLGHRTDLFEKLMNNPEAAAWQVANTMLGIKERPPRVEREVEKLNSVLDSITL